MSSPMTGKRACSKRRRQSASEAMNTGMQLTNAQPASSARSAYHSVARCDPTGKYETSTSVRVRRNVSATSASGPSASTISSRNCVPSPSSVRPRSTFTPSGGTSANRRVLFGSASRASARSLPTLRALMSKAAEISMSATPYRPTEGLIRPGMVSSRCALR